MLFLPAADILAANILTYGNRHWVAPDARLGIQASAAVQADEHAQYYLPLPPYPHRTSIITALLYVHHPTQTSTLFFRNIINLPILSNLP